MTGLFTKLRTLAQSVRNSLWFIPAVMVLVIIPLAFLMLWVDRNYAAYITNQLSWLFSGTASAARSLLSTVASAVITVVSIAFSLTIVAMQQASSQYTPRLLRTFISNRGNQIVLGAYLATFVYSLLVLRAVREADESIVAFVPSVATSFAILLALVCVGLLIYFINHVATSLQATTVISRVHSELLQQIAKLYPDNIGKPAEDDASSDARFLEKQNKNHQKLSIASQKTGFIIQISTSELEKIDFGPIDLIHVLPKVGDFVAYGEAIAEISSSESGYKLQDGADKKVRQAIAITNQRSIEQDPLFAIRQLVDTALKGLSPGINDMTTADYCIRYLGDALGRLAHLKFPSAMRKLENGSTLYLEKPDWDDFVEGSFKQLLHASASQVQVLHVLLRTLYRLSEQLPSQERTLPVRGLLDTFDEILSQGSYLPSDKRALQTEVRDLRRRLDKVPQQ